MNTLHVNVIERVPTHLSNVMLKVLLADRWSLVLVRAIRHLFRASVQMNILKSSMAQSYNDSQNLLQNEARGRAKGNERTW